jgi:hypothetical protein
MVVKDADNRRNKMKATWEHYYVGNSIIIKLFQNKKDINNQKMTSRIINNLETAMKNYSMYTYTHIVPY